MDKETGNNYKRIGVITFSQHTMNMILIIIAIIMASVPLMHYYIPTIVWLVVMLLWYAHVFLTKNRVFLEKKIVFIFLFWIFWNIFLSLIGFSTAALGNYVVLFAFFDILIKTMYVRDNYSLQLKNSLLRFLQFLLLANILSNIVIGFQYVNIHNLISFYPELYGNLNVARTEFYNMTAFFIGISIFMLQKEKNYFFRMIEILSVVCGVFFLLNFAPRFHATILMIAAFISAFMSYNKNQQSWLLSGLLLVIFISVILLFLGSDFVR